ncbi:MAG: protein translocase SEC61 complex subunit gamma [Candidatus Pacearchaeota archaeon]
MKIKEFLQQCGRVLRIARKPTAEEIKQVSKISALGLLIIGMIGFIITILFVVAF